MIPGLDSIFLLSAVGGLLTLTSNLMKRMVPLRVFAILANAVFIVPAVLGHDWVAAALQTTLFFVNAWRLWALRGLLQAIERANADTPVRDWLLPFMKKKWFEAGETVFRKGDAAHQLIYIRDGTMRVVEAGVTMGAGSLVGEIGLFNESRQRTATMVCETRCLCYTMTDEAIHLLYLQNPTIGFYLIRLIVQRLLQDLQRRTEAVA